MQASSRKKSIARLEQLGKFLDGAIPFGKSGYKIGIDPIVGLIPGIGDSMSALIGGYIVIEAARLGVSRLTLVRMLINLGFDAIVGIVPFLGDLFDFAFRANIRNLQLIKEAKLSAEDNPPKKFVSAILLTFLMLFIVLLVIIIVSVLITVNLFSYLFK